MLNGREVMSSVTSRALYFKAAELGNVVVRCLTYSRDVLGYIPNCYLPLGFNVFLNSL